MKINRYGPVERIRGGRQEAAQHQAAAQGGLLLSGGQLGHLGSVDITTQPQLSRGHRVQQRPEAGVVLPAELEQDPHHGEAVLVPHGLADVRIPGRGHTRYHLFYIYLHLFYIYLHPATADLAL